MEYGYYSSFSDFGGGENQALAPGGQGRFQFIRQRKSRALKRCF